MSSSTQALNQTTGEETEPNERDSTDQSKAYQKRTKTYQNSPSMHKHRYTGTRHSVSLIPAQVLARNPFTWTLYADFKGKTLLLKIEDFYLCSIHIYSFIHLMQFMCPDAWSGLRMWSGQARIAAVMCSPLDRGMTVNKSLQAHTLSSLIVRWLELLDGTQKAVTQTYHVHFDPYSN